jgi:hypothetical protein
MYVKPTSEVPIHERICIGYLRVWKTYEGDIKSLKYLVEKLKGGVHMADKVKSKTDVSARAEAKNRTQICSVCGNKINVVLAVSPTGKKRIKRVCCEG